MTLDDAGLNAIASPPRSANAVERLSLLGTEFASETLRRAVDDAGAAMAHQLSEPLTALLLYLHEIRQAGEQFEGAQSAPASVREMVDLALRETERVCDIVERVGETREVPVDAEAAVARGREAIDAWRSNGRVRTGDAVSRVHRRPHLHLLTPREQEVLALITGGSSNKDGGHRLGISRRTFEAHRARIMWKFGARNAADLMCKTLDRKITPGLRVETAPADKFRRMSCKTRQY